MRRGGFDPNQARSLGCDSASVTLRQPIRGTTIRLDPGIACPMGKRQANSASLIVQKRLRSSVAVSAVGMVTPFVLGAGLAYALYYQTELFPEADLH